MQIDLALIKLVLLAIPGMIAALLYRKLTGQRDQKTWHELFDIVVFSLFSYAILAVGYRILGCLLGIELRVGFFGVLLSKDADFTSWHEVVLASAIACILSFFGSLVYTRNWINKLAYTLRVTKRNFDGDLWESFNASPSSDWVIVRDHKLDLVYFGWVKGYSESDRDREMILSDVDVYPNKENRGRLYSVQELYISRARDDLSIEVPIPTGNA